MKIIYRDEYNETIFTNALASAVSPFVGDTVIFDEEDWIVKSRTFFPKYDALIIELTQTIVRQKEDNTAGARLTELGNAIINGNKRQDVSEKKARSTRDQLASVRQYVKRSTPKPPQDTK
jgi:hypothetical protein